MARIPDDELNAFLDGKEPEPGDRARIEAAVRDDPEVSNRLDALRRRRAIHLLHDPEADGVVVARPPTAPGTGRRGIALAGAWVGSLVVAGALGWHGSAWVRASPPSAPPVADRGASLAPTVPEGEEDGDVPAWVERLTGGGGASALVVSDGEPDDVGSSLAIPGLRLVGVGWDDVAGGMSGLRLRQLLPTGDTLELRYVGLFRTGPEPPGKLFERASDGRLTPHPALSAQIHEATLPSGWNQVVVRHRGRWVVARAPLEPAALRSLLMLLR